MKRITAFLICFMMIFMVIPVSAASGYCYNCEGTYSYSEYYSSTRHRRIYACNDCGEGSYEYDYHSSSTSYSQLNSTQHSVSSVCSDCGETLTETTENHSFSYGSWSNYSDSQHRRTKTCTDCGYSDYDYSNHSLSYGNWQNYSDSQHRRTKTCATCNYSGYDYASHSFTYGTWSSISESEHQRTKKCSCGYSSTEKAVHKDSNNDGICDDCGEILGLTVEWNASANGGTIEGFSGKSTKVKINSIAKAPDITPVKEGYNFTGWFTEISGGESYDTIQITSETTFYAQFEPTTYDITWDTQNSQMLSTSQLYGEVLIFPEEPERDGYTFAGWHTEAVGGELIEEGIIYHKAENSIFYAHWDENPDVFSVTVPAMLVLTMSEQGKVYSAENAEIVNNSTDAVKVKSVSLSAENGWSIVPFSNNMSTEKVDANVIGFSLNNVKTSVKGNQENLNILNDWSIGEGGALPLTYDAVVSAVSQAVNNKQVLTVVFVIDWDR